MKPALVPLEYVPLVYQRMASHLDKAIQHNRCSVWNLWTLYHAIMTRQVFMYVDDLNEPRNVMTIRQEIWGGEPVVLVMFLAGEGGMNWRDALKILSREWKEQHGINRVAAVWRKGWQRFGWGNDSKKLPFKELATVVEFDFGDDQ